MLKPGALDLYIDRGTGAYLAGPGETLGTFDFDLPNLRSMLK
jgi:hypothetical protein